VVGPGWAVTVPDQARLQPRLNSISNCDALHSAAIAAGGSNDYGQSLNVLLQGNSTGGVTVRTSIPTSFAAIALKHWSWTDRAKKEAPYSSSQML
jgi:hypothetical protein